LLYKQLFETTSRFRPFTVALPMQKIWKARAQKRLDELYATSLKVYTEINLSKILPSSLMKDIL